MGKDTATDTPRRVELASYLKARRASLQPYDVGLRPPPGRRNTPGLRREEVAHLSGVGLTWYTWLEQARPITTTVPVIDALARTFRLDREAHGHLRCLAGLPMPESDHMPDGAGHDLNRLLDTLMPAPACIFGPSFDFVAWNHSFAKIWHPETLPVGRRNVIWMIFAEPDCRRTCVNWEQRARILLAEFRAAAGQHAGDQRFDELIQALSEASNEFASWWASYEVRHSITGDLKVRQPGLSTIAFHVVELRVCGYPSLTCSAHVPAHPSDERKVAALAATRSRARVA